MMLRSLNLLLGFSSSQFWRWSPLSSISLPKIVPLFDLNMASSPQFLLPRCNVHVKALQMSSGGSESLPVPNSAHKLKDKFCQFCGGLTKQMIPDGDEKMRAVCTVCGAILYENPKMVVGCLVEHDGKVLLCKRNIHPSHGLWTLPAGYLEIGESAVEGAMRETLEEANAEVEVISPFAQLDIPHIGQSYIIFRAKMKKPHFSPGPESLECRLFKLDDIPFGSLAFSSIYATLKMYAEDTKKGKLRFHYCSINKRPGASLSDPNGFDVVHHLHS